MPVKVYKKGKNFCVTDRSRVTKKGRCHSNKNKATRQMRAINMSLRKEGKI